MNELSVQNVDGKLMTDSRDVAKMIGKVHKNLLSDIRSYTSSILSLVDEKGRLRVQPSEFFIESTYINSQNKTQPCFLLTKKGCDMVANKMIGVKGVHFTAMYVTRFDEMEAKLKEVNNPSYMIDDPILRAKAWIVEAEQKQALVMQIEEQKPMVNSYKNLMDATGHYTLAIVAKSCGWGRNTFMKQLREDKILQSGGSGSELNVPYQNFMSRGYFKVVSKSIGFNAEICNVTLVTPRGMGYLEKRYAKSDKLQLAE